MYEPLDAYNRLTRAPRAEWTDQPLVLESGQVPRDLAGTLWRNGPGSLESCGVPYHHLFDGDGYIQRFAIADGEIHYTARFVRTTELLHERLLGRPAYRSFGTNLRGGLPANALRMHFKNAANTSILPIGDEVLALWEGGAPYRVDAATLETKPGQWINGGALAPRGPIERLMGTGRPFSAHPKHLASREEILNFGMLPGPRQRVLLHRLPATPDGAIDGASDSRLGSTRELILPELTFAHDFVALDDGRRVMFDVPVAFDVIATMVGSTTAVGSIRERRDRPTIIRTIDDRLPTKAITQRTAETDPMYVFHFPNGYRAAGEAGRGEAGAARADGSSTIVIDACRMDHFPSADDIAQLMVGEAPASPFSALLTRYEIDESSGSVTTRQLSDYPMELPTIHPAYRARPYRYIWAVADRPDRHSPTLHGIVRFDLERGTEHFVDFFPGFAGEPLFVPRTGAGGEDDGWLLVLALDVTAEVGRLHVFDAATMTEVARLRLPAPVHVGFHGFWRSSQGSNQG